MVASGGVVPVCVETVVGGAVACRLVLGDWFGACREGLQVGEGPVLVVPHRLVGLLVQRG